MNRRCFILIPLFLPLAACQQTDGAASGAAALVRAPDVPITILAVDGIPEAVNEPLLDSLSEAATSRGIVLVEADKKPRYQIKGYFSAAPGTNGTEISYVWDALDTQTQSSERVEGSAMTPRRAEDPWAVLDESTRKALAAQSMNDLARYLSRGSAAAE